MASARCTSTPSRVSGPCCAPGSARIAVSRRKSCRTTSASSNMCTTHAVAAKPCSARSSPPWSYDPAQHPGSQQEPPSKLDQPGLAFVQAEPELGEPVRQGGQHPERIRPVLEEEQVIVGIPDKADVPPCFAPPPLRHPEVEGVMQVDVGQER